MGKAVHVLAVALPAQGHAIPLMKLSERLIHYGVKVTFVKGAGVIEEAIVEKCEEHSLLRIVLVPDGMDPEEERKNPWKGIEIRPRVMSGHIKKLITKFNESDNEEDKISWVIADLTMGWVLEMAQDMGIQTAGFWPVAVFGLKETLDIPKLFEDGIIDEDGIPKADLQEKNNTTSKDLQKLFFEYGKMVIRGAKQVNWILCNSIYYLESTNCDMVPGILPIGPLPPLDGPGVPVVSHWKEDSTCLRWLDEQPIHSVIYIAFGSTSIFDQQQFDEITFALEQLDNPFLWVVRSDLINDHPHESRYRVPPHGKIVSWAPQHKVLGHPSIACFISHCGWNSTIEGLSSGVPFLCWPYFADQFQNQDYICDVWKVGLRLNQDENGKISRDEIKRKVKQLLCDEGINANALELKDIALKGLGEGGSSKKNLDNFVELLQK